MRIAMITVNDPAGVGIQMTNAINRLTEHTCRLITTEYRYNFAFQKDLHVPALDGQGLEELASVLETSDIYHFHLLADENLQLGPYVVKDFLKKQILVHHHHGHPDFRGYPEKYQKKYRELGRDNLLVSTPDLLHLLPGARWQPNFVPTDDPLFMPPEDPLPAEAGVLRIGHSPTRKELKNTDELRAIVARLNTEEPGRYYQLDQIENTPYVDCLRRKQHCDVLFDHMQGYFGMSSLEGLSQGRPTIAGVDDWNIGHIRDYFGCDSVPWVLARNSDELAATLRRFMDAPDECLAIGAASRAFLEQTWNAARCILPLIEWYQRLS